MIVRVLILTIIIVYISVRRIDISLTSFIVRRLVLMAIIIIVLNMIIIVIPYCMCYYYYSS